jgi:hypothetical protein
MSIRLEGSIRRQLVTLQCGVTKSHRRTAAPRVNLKFGHDMPFGRWLGIALSYPYGVGKHRLLGQFDAVTVVSNKVNSIRPRRESGQTLRACPNPVLV